MSVEQLVKDVCQDNPGAWRIVMSELVWFRDWTDMLAHLYKHGPKGEELYLAVQEAKGWHPYGLKLREEMNKCRTDRSNSPVDSSLCRMQLGAASAIQKTLV